MPTPGPHSAAEEHTPELQRSLLPSLLREGGLDHTELVAVRVAQHHEIVAGIIAPRQPGRAQGYQALDLRLLILGVQVEVQAIATLFGFVSELEREVGPAAASSRPRTT
jgi:hypothetical protein